MKWRKQQELISKLFTESKELLLTKGKDYADDNDSLANFKLNARLLGLSKYQVWSIYFMKHVESVLNAIKRSPEFPQVKSEPIENRIKDIINYAALLYCMLEEDKENLK